MSPESIGQALVGFGLMCLAAYNAWQTVQAKREAKHANRHAAQAATNSKPVSNGFTAEIRTSLADILTIATEARNEATLARELGESNRDAHTRHLEAHANTPLYALPDRRAMH